MPSSSDRDGTAGAGRREVLIVVNPHAGRKRGRTIADTVTEAARRFGLAPLIELTREPGHATTIALEYLRRGVRDLLVVGGDGTLSEVATGILWAVDAGHVEPVEDGERAPITLGVVHAGTGGDLCRDLELPRDHSEAAAVALCGPARPLDLGVAAFDLGRRGFFNVANVGMSAEVVRIANGPARRLGGTGAFAAAAVTALARVKPTMLTLSFDGEEHQFDAAVTDVIVCNGQYEGGGMHAAPLAALDDGILDTVIVGAASPVRLLGKLPKIYRGTHVDDELVRYERRSRVDIDAAPDAPAAAVILDGEPSGYTPVSFTLMQGVVQVRVPAASAPRM